MVLFLKIVEILKISKFDKYYITDYYYYITDVSTIVEAPLCTSCCASAGAGTAGCHTFCRSLDHESCM